MNSPFANIYLAIQQQIQTAVLNPDNTPMIPSIDQDLGQLDYYKVRPSVSFPCILIDFSNWRFSNMSENAQLAEGDVILRLGFQPFSGSGQETPEAYREKSINYYDIEWAIHQALQGWSPGDDYGVLVRKCVETEKRKDPFRVRVITYSLKFDDYSTVRELQFIGAEINIDTEINEG
ncbi:MAG TPA: hypothetical protein VN721_16585 [Flavipsychrobacter sp.]|nr:hypothetical protein [Flavipsychrobacter sp.]